MIIKDNLETFRSMCEDYKNRGIFTEEHIRKYGKANMSYTYGFILFSVTIKQWW